MLLPHRQKIRLEKKLPCGMCLYGPCSSFVSSKDCKNYGLEVGWGAMLILVASAALSDSTFLIARPPQHQNTQKKTHEYLLHIVI